MIDEELKARILAPLKEGRDRLARRFVLVRYEDVNTVSGVGLVADGVEFADGVCVMRWRGKQRSTTIYDNIEILEGIHGHGGKSQIEWVD